MGVSAGGACVRSCRVRKKGSENFRRALFCIRQGAGKGLAVVEVL
jgi:hypothetical protein